MSTSGFIGFDRKVELEWLDAVAARASAGDTRLEAMRWLHAVALSTLAGDGAHGAKGKTATVLLRIWYPQDAQSLELRNTALKLLPDASPSDRLALHWALSIAAYPFFAAVAQQVGRLIALQGDASARDVTRRVAEKYGDRSTLPRAVQRVLGSMAAWKAVVVEHAVLRPTVKHAVSAPVALLLARAVLFGLPGRSVPLEALVREPALFAFDVSLTLADVQRDTSLQVDRLGYDDVHVRVR
jgi:hypothetical protein